MSDAINFQSSSIKKESRVMTKENLAFPTVGARIAFSLSLIKPAGLVDPGESNQIMYRVVMIHHFFLKLLKGQTPDSF